MKIVIFSGGTGSIAVQRGLYHALDERLDGIDTKIIVNAYDNGLSTGAVRKVMNGQILGPSDVRKNQTTRLELKNPTSPWLQFLNDRVTAEPHTIADICKKKIGQLMKELAKEGPLVDSSNVLFGAIERYAALPLATKIEYDNFSLANIVYAGLAHANGNSLRTAARLMAEAMNIPDNVLLNDDTSMFLGAITQSGRRVTDEAEIVRWGNEAEPFFDVFFVDANGADARPELCLEAWQAILEADLMILSSGTQWSSLIPTYASNGFKTAVNNSRATVLMVMNRIPDKDSPSQTASDIINILVPRYFEMHRLHVMADRNGHPNMRTLSDTALAKVASFTQSDLSKPSDPTDRHNPNKLAEGIGYVFFRDHLDSNFYLFDYDDTLVGRDNTCPKSSRFNIVGISRLNPLTEVGICTGNTIRSIDLTCNPADVLKDVDVGKPLVVFADGGINEYSYQAKPLADAKSNPPKLRKCIWAEAALPTTGPYCPTRVIESLLRVGVPLSKIDNRGNALIAIKPISADYRHALFSLVQHILRGSKLKVRESGKTTIEIYNSGLSKVCALKHLHTTSPTPLRITYVGDELESGNDRDIRELETAARNVKCLHVSSPAKTAFFVSTLLTRLNSHDQR